jgi:branched-chain amino acid transport system permease protein
VRDVDLRQPHEEPHVLPAAHGMSQLAAARVGRPELRAPRWIAVLAVAAVLPLFVGAGSVALENMVLAAAYVVMSLGLNVVVGFAGLLDLGYVAFFAIGAHVAAYFGSAFWGIHVDFLVILVLAAVAATIAGVLIGLPTLRLRGDYVGIVTLAFGEIIGQIVVNGQDIHLFGGTLTGGPSGITAIDRIDLPFIDRFGALDLRPWYWFALALVAFTLVVNFRLRDSRLGRAWVALREDEAVAACMGVPIVRTKLRAYGVGAALGGVAGAFLASYLSTVNPGQFTFSFSIFILAMVVVGGMGSIWGVVVGAIVLSVINNYVLHDLPGTLGIQADLSEIAPAVYGFLLVIMMLLRPEGFIPARGGGRSS